MLRLERPACATCHMRRRRRWPRWRRACGVSARVLAQVLTISRYFPGVLRKL